MNIENFKIRKYRKQFKLRQEDLATNIDVSTQLIRMYENGTRNPSLEKKRLICNLFDITLNELEGLTDKEQLKMELMNLISTFNLDKDTFQITKAETLHNFHLLFNEQIEVTYVISNAQLYTGKIIKYILNFVLKSYICESIFTETCYNEKLLDQNKPNINKLLVDFIKSNIRFIESTIEELYYDESNSKCMIPITNNLVDNFELIKSSATQFLEVPQKFKNKLLYGYKINNNEMSMKYEIGNIAIIELTDIFSNNDDVIISINNLVKLRRIQKNESGIFIQPLNQLFKNEFYTNEEIKKMDIKIIGKVLCIKI